MKHDSHNAFHKNSSINIGFSKWIFISILLITIGVLLGGLWLIYKYQSEKIFHTKSNELQTIADIKSDQIRQWYQDQLNDTQLYAKEFFSDELSAASLTNIPLVDNENINRMARFLIDSKEYENIMPRFPRTTKCYSHFMMK